MQKLHMASYQTKPIKYKWGLNELYNIVTTRSLTVAFIEHLSSCNFRWFTVTTRFVERPAFSIRTVIDLRQMLRLFPTSIFDNITSAAPVSLFWSSSCTLACAYSFQTWLL